MRRTLGLLLGLTLVAALVRFLRRRQSELAPAPPGLEGRDPREELRRKLAQTREPEDDEPPLPETSGEQPADAGGAEPTGEIELERRTVHERARAAIDEMRAAEPERQGRGDA